MIGPVEAPDVESAKVMIGHWIGRHAGMFASRVLATAELRIGSMRWDSSPRIAVAPAQQSHTLAVGERGQAGRDRSHLRDAS